MSAALPNTIQTKGCHLYEEKRRTRTDVFSLLLLRCRVLILSEMDRHGWALIAAELFYLVPVMS